MRHLADTVNHYAPALTLLIVIGGFVWTIATWNAEFGTVKRDLQELGDDLDELRDEVRSVQDEVRSVRETLSHVVSCVIDLERSRIASTLGGGDSARGDAPGTLFDATLPASCEQARSRTTPRAN